MLSKIIWTLSTANGDTIFESNQDFATLSPNRLVIANKNDIIVSV